MASLKIQLLEEFNGEFHPFVKDTVAEARFCVDAHCERVVIDITDHVVDGQGEIHADEMF